MASTKLEEDMVLWVLENALVIMLELTRSDQSEELGAHSAHFQILTIHLSALAVVPVVGLVEGVSKMNVALAVMAMN